VPFVRGVADLEALQGFIVEPAGVAVVKCLPAHIAAEVLAVPGGEGFVQGVEEIFALALFGTLLPGLGVVVLFGDLEAREVGQDLHGFEEFDVLELADEVDKIAAFLAAEAVEELLVGTDLEGGGLFVVEGSAGFEVVAGLLEGDVTVDQIDDVDPIFELADKGVVDHGGGRRQLPTGHGRVVPQSWLKAFGF